MTLNTIRPSSPIADRGPTSGPAARVLVIFEPSSNGAAALAHAAELTNASRAELTVVTVAPQQPCTRCCGPSAEPFNAAVREDAERDLRAARELAGPVADRALFEVLVGGCDPSLPAWIAEQMFDLVLLPSHRFTFGGHRIARKLRRSTQAEVRVVGSSEPVGAGSGS